MAIAGWYPDPQHAGAEQYWDGDQWTGQRRGRTTPDEPAGHQHGDHPHGDGDESDLQTRVNPAWRNQPAAAQPPGSAPAGNQPANAQSPGGSDQGPGQQASGPLGQPWTGQQGYPPPSYPPPGPQWQGGPPPAGGTDRGRRKLLIVAAAVVVVLVAAGLVTWLVWPSSSPSLTYKDKSIESPGDVLAAAEKTVGARVGRQHGAKTGDTRCYFSKPTKPASGASKSNVDDHLVCGPVLFVDGDKTKQYLFVPFTASVVSGKEKLTPSSSIDGIIPQAISSSVTLERPDGEKPPSGAGGLTVPQPPPAAKTALLATGLGPVAAPPSLDNAVMASKNIKVTLAAAGQVTRYGAGTDARSAPPGTRLYAFQISYGEGEFSSSSSTAQVVVGDGSPRDIPDATGDTWDVVVVPDSETAVIQIDDAGYTQTLALPDGKPGRGNLGVLARTHRTDLRTRSFTVPVRASSGSASRTSVFRTTLNIAYLFFWPSVAKTKHPSSPGKAYLSVNMNYRFPPDPGHTFGYDPSLLTLTLPNGTTVHARNLANSGKVSDFFEVPDDFTRGTVTIAGSQRIQGVTLRITKPHSFPIRIAAG